MLLAPPGVQSLDIIGPAEIFWEAARRLNNPTAYDIQVMSTGAPTVSGTGQLGLVADRTIIDPDEPIDTLLLAGDPSLQEIDPRYRMASAQSADCPALRLAFLLAAASLLVGRRVTTHWECTDKVQQGFPAYCTRRRCDLRARRPLLHGGGRHGGHRSGARSVEEDYGRDVAMIVARYMVVFLKRPGSQSQFSAHLVAQMSETTLIQRVQEYMLANLASPLHVDQIAHASAWVRAISPASSAARST